ncbi:MAG: type I restriction enzyme HsdR N-terminal domain-containing protein [Acidimicrobiia bacterium]|nr:type I restriction enzyme HsdR N-terminal domain-containing protein [Acidimicrobiia bacterium]
MFREKITEHGLRVETLLNDFPEIKTIEASTKSSLIEPLLRCLGYDTSHPQQVALEVLTELGGRIDYVLTGGTNVKIAVEAKKAGTTLSVKETNQLRSYFTFSEAVAGVLTNGIDVWLFTDLDKANVMDAEPYLTVDIRNVTDNDIHHLQTLTRMQVNPTAIHEQAQRERYRTQVNTIVAEELAAPSQEFLRLVGKKVGIKPLTKAHLKLLRPLITEALKRARGPLRHDPPPPPPKPPPPPQKPPPPPKPMTPAPRPWQVSLENPFLLKTIGRYLFR